MKRGRQKKKKKTRQQNVSPIGKRVIEIASQRGLSLFALARTIGWSRQDLHQRLRRRSPRVSTLVQIARALEVPITDLLPTDLNSLVSDEQ